MKPTIIYLLLGALPLLGYPFVLVANIMSLGAERSDDRRFFLSFVSYGFLLGSLAYPLVYITCLILTPLMLTNQKADTATLLSVTPLGYLFTVVIFCFLWVSANRKI
jgi:hypothetical protein